MARGCDSRVEDALLAAAADVERTGSGRWRFSLVNGAVRPVGARVADGWLELTTVVPEAARMEQAPLSCLRLNARFGGSVRAARARGDAAFHIRTDVNLDEATGLAGRIGSACEQVHDALHLLQPGASDMLPWPQAEGESQPIGPDSIAGDIERLCAEAGWPCTATAASELRLDIETRAGVFGARIEPAGGGAERVVVELADMAAQSATSQRAVAMFLLALSSAVRAVKGVVLEREGGDVFALASPIEAPTVQALDRSLSALAVACQISGREVQALRDERLADAYLALWEASSQHGSLTTEEEHTCQQQP